jgi:hypothetical protein
MLFFTGASEFLWLVKFKTGGADVTKWLLFADLFADY